MSAYVPFRKLVPPELVDQFRPELEEIVHSIHVLTPTVETADFTASVFLVWALQEIVRLRTRLSALEQRT